MYDGQVSCIAIIILVAACVCVCVCARLCVCRGLDYFSTECIYSPNAYRGFAREYQAR